MENIIPDESANVGTVRLVWVAKAGSTPKAFGARILIRDMAGIREATTIKGTNASVPPVKASRPVLIGDGSPKTLSSSDTVSADQRTQYQT